MTDRFASITAKIERAEKHINDFGTEWIALGRRAYEVVPDKELDEEGRRPFRIRIKEDIPNSLSTIIGDAVGNMRTALDYTIYQLLDREKIEVSRHHYFPISANADGFKSSFQAKIKGVGDEAEGLIEGLKPYRGGTDGFWHLNELCRTDKHRLLLTVVIRPAVTALSLSDIFKSMDRLAGTASAPSRNRDAMLNELEGKFVFLKGKSAPCPGLKDGEIIYSQPREMDSHQDTQFGFVIAFGEGEILECESVTEVLQQLLDLTKGATEVFRPLLT